VPSIMTLLVRFDLIICIQILFCSHHFPLSQ